MKVISFIAVTLLATQAFAGTKIKKVDLDDENPVIIRGSLDSDAIYYHMDTKGCLCWMSVFPDISYPLDISTFDCQKLKAYKAYEKAVEACYPKPEPKELVSQPTPEAITPVATAAVPETEGKAAIPEEKETKVVPVEGIEGPKPASAE